jgi:cytochrome c553
VITDADGNEYTLEPNQSGNFTSNQAIATPYTARLVTADGERKMFTPQTIGDCNSCHTQDGMSGAPGRIVLP